MKRTTIMIAGLIGFVLIGTMVSALNPLQGDDWALDPDMDGLNNREEFLAGSDPNMWDSDGDGLPDGWEVDNSLDPRDPKDADEDNDYFGGEEYSAYSQVDSPYTNYDEYFRVAYVNSDTGENVYIPTNPNDPDTDGDGIYDPDDSYPWDIDPTGGPGGPGGPTPPAPPDELKDTDKDGLLDYYEFQIGTDPYNRDTDGDTLLDSNELRLGLDPNDWDTDNDMLVDGCEEGAGQSTDGHLEDTDNDGL